MLAFRTPATFLALAPPPAMLTYLTPATFLALAPPPAMLAYHTPATFPAPVLPAPMPAQLSFAGQMVGLSPIGKPLIQVILHEHLALIAASHLFLLTVFLAPRRFGGHHHGWALLTARLISELTWSSRLTRVADLRPWPFAA